MTNFLGVVGGMGPLATADFLGKLVLKTAATVDQEHIPIIVYGDCTVPDRTASLLGMGPSPLPNLLQGINFLNRAGVSAICIPCNSAHAWFAEMEAASTVPLFHIVRASIDHILKKMPGAEVVGVLSTLGTHQTGIYSSTLSAMGFAIRTPTDEEFRTLVSPGIAFIKANQLERAELVFEEAAARLVERGAEVIVLGCTEIPIGMKRQYQRQPSLFVDSNEALAMSVVEFFNGLR
jgi:aspartate racemase